MQPMCMDKISKRSQNEIKRLEVMKWNVHDEDGFFWVKVANTAEGRVCQVP